MPIQKEDKYMSGAWREGCKRWIPKASSSIPPTSGHASLRLFSTVLDAKKRTGKRKIRTSTILNRLFPRGTMISG
jgi:hypothetical protein